MIALTQDEADVLAGEWPWDAVNPDFPTPLLIRLGEHLRAELKARENPTP
jgi:hypothetical protein